MTLLLPQNTPHVTHHTQLIVTALKLVGMMYLHLPPPLLPTLTTSGEYVMRDSDGGAHALRLPYAHDDGSADAVAAIELLKGDGP
jgi:hypothetical protein